MAEEQTSGARPGKRRRMLNPEERGRIAEEICNTILGHTRQRFSFTDHLVSATLIQSDRFEDYNKSFPELAVATTLKAYPVLNANRLKTELAVIYSKEDLRTCRGAINLLHMFSESNLSHQELEKCEVKTRLTEGSVRRSQQTLTIRLDEAVEAAVALDLEHRIRTKSETVSGVYMQKCLLPCTIANGEAEIIDWSNRNMDGAVHVLREGKDELDNQNKAAALRSCGDVAAAPDQAANVPEATGPWSERPFCAFPECTYGQSAPGSPEEIYLCSCRSEFLFSAPVESLMGEFRGEVMVCSSENIYPEPKVSWSPKPAHQTQSQIVKNDNGLYSINSSASMKLEAPQQFTCNISTENSWKSATYSLNSPVKRSSSVKLRCSNSSAPVKSLKWTFKYNQTILTQRGADVMYPESWKTSLEGLSESGDVYLKDLSSEQEGVYLCELHTDQHSFFSKTEIKPKPPFKAPLTPGEIAGAVFGGLFGILHICFGSFFLFCTVDLPNEARSDEI
ncbi:hypothetical protein WMY93_015344 [Mugilogobius chulae]|uniref:Ig-like domain-containing protein n=1 Tax=Mugilogobius chulae TaxID=88201 RepID=A0AAW0NQX8_9GOBI